jgi:hypothetical protein
MTASQPQELSEGSLPRSSLQSVTLPAGEAAESLRIILASSTAANLRLFPDLGEIDLRPTENQLVFFPFTPTGNDLVQTKLRISIQRNALQFGRNL